MKKVNGLFAGVFTLLMLLSGCDNNSVDKAQIVTEKGKVQSSLTLSKAYNDTLKMVYDTVKVHKNNSYCLKYDKLYHQNDSMFTVHYNMFGDEMYKYGFMMAGYSTTGGMMKGGMMDNDSNYKTMIGDTATVGAYYRSMCLIRIAHQTYHNGIYN